MILPSEQMNPFAFSRKTKPSAVPTSSIFKHCQIRPRVKIVSERWREG